MHKRVISIFLLMAMVLVLVGCDLGYTYKESDELWERNRDRAFELGNRYKADYYNEDTHLLYRFLDEKDTASCWEYVGLMSLQDKLAKLDSDEIENLDNVIDGLFYYGKQQGGKFWAFVVDRGSQPYGAPNSKIAYDDDEWLIINYLRAYEITDNKEYLDMAEYLTRFILEEAWFEPLGGIFWDYRKEARHACSNNPMIKPLVDLYKHTDDEFYLDWAIKVYDFSRNALKNEELNIYYDLVGAKKVGDKWVEGKPAEDYYTYNTGTMISGAAALYGVTGEQKYLDEALSCAQGALEFFGDTDDKEGYVNWPSRANVWFNSILLRGYIDLYPYAKEETLPYIETFQRSIDYAYDNYYKDGYLPRDWINGWDNEKDGAKYALDRSATAEIYAMLALFEKEK